MYLRECSAFHAQKAEYLKESGKGTPEQIEYENLQSELFKNPDNDIINFFKEKVHLQYRNRLAFTEWDEGMGACGHEINENRTINAVKMYLNTVLKISDYIDKLKIVREQSTGTKQKYFDYEIKYAERLLFTTMKYVAGMAQWTINPNNKTNFSYGNVPDEVREEFKISGDSFQNVPSYDDGIREKATKFKEFYAEILKLYKS